MTTATHGRPMTERIEVWADAHQQVAYAIADLSVVRCCPWQWTRDRVLDIASRVHQAGRLLGRRPGEQLQTIAAEMVTPCELQRWAANPEQRAHQFIRRLRSFRWPTIRRS